MSPERRYFQVLEVQQNIESLGTQELEAFAFSREGTIKAVRPHYLYCAALATMASEATAESRPQDSAYFKSIQDELLARVLPD